MNMDITKALFAYTHETVEVIDTLIGAVGAAGASASTHRPAGVYTGAKISAVASIFDLLLKYPGSVALYYCQDTETVYCEINKCRFFASKHELKTDSTMKRKYHIVPFVFHQLICGENTELMGVFNAVLSQYKGTGSEVQTDVYKFCDSFYYGNVIKEKVTLDENPVTEAEAKAAFRSNSWEKIDFGFPIYFGESEDVTPAKKKKAAAKKKSNFLQDCKDGKYRIPFEWPAEVAGKVVDKKFLDSFEPTSEFEEIVKKIKFRADKILERMDMGCTGADAIGKDAMNILLLGKPGTGKTTLAYGLSAACGIPICTTAHNKHTDEDEYEGKTKIIDSKPTYVETDSLLMHQFGGIDVCEEINLADPSVTMGGLGQKLEFPYIVKANGYKTVVRHPLNIVIGTLNVGTNGSNPLNQALANRFKTAFLLDDPTRETFIGILEKASKKSREVCEWVYTAYDKTVAYLKSPAVNEEEICQNLSIRTCLGALDNMEEGQTPSRALINSIAGAIAVVDLEVARNVQREVIELLPEFSGEM